MDAATPLSNLFLHFFDIHFLEEVGARASRQLLEAEADLAIRIGILAARTLIVPAASYFESPLCKNVLDRFGPLMENGTIQLAGSGPNSEVFAKIKLEQYDDGSLQHLAYQTFLDSDEVTPPFLTRNRSATSDLIARWEDLAGSPNLPAQIFDGTYGLIPLSFDEDWASLPERLGGRAFTPEYVTKTLLGSDAHSAVRANISAVINDGYFSSFSQEYEAGFIVDLVRLQAPYALSNVFGNVPFRQVRDALERTGTLAKVRKASPTELLQLRSEPAVVEALLTHIQEVEGTYPRFRAAKLPIQLDLQNQVEAIKKIKRGRREASTYHRAVANFLDDVFGHSLRNRQIEDEINEKRKRIDITWVNAGYTGFFAWVRSETNAGAVYAEAKNYTEDVNNPEIDQLLGRFSPHRTKFGLLLCRSVADKATAVNRCRDAVRDHQGFVFILTDADLQELSELSADPAWGSGQSEWLHAKWRQIT